MLKGQVSSSQRKELVSRLQAHQRSALNRLAQAVEARDRQVNALNYSRMHHRHSKNLSN